MGKYSRTPLRCGTEIILTDDNDNQIKYVIDKAIGYGGSSIVYKAINDKELPIILKEFYPVELEGHILRTHNETLVTEEKERFEFLKDKFIDSYYKHLKICGEVDMNHTPYLLPQYKGYGTVFIGMSPRDGDTLEISGASTLYEAVIIAIKLTKIIKEYHNAGYLHLDIKPSNIFKDKDELNLYMFDFDSLCEIPDVSNDNVPYSYTKGWAPPELENGLYDDICDATDIYSIGAVFYWMLFNNIPYESADSVVSLSVLLYDVEPFKEYLSKDSPLVKEFNRDLNNVLELITNIISKTLAASPKSRFQSTDELLENLNKLEALTRENSTSANSVLDEYRHTLLDTMLQLPNEPGYNANFKERNESYNKKINSLDKANSFTSLEKNSMQTLNAMHRHDMSKVYEHTPVLLREIENTVSDLYAVILKELTDRGIISLDYANMIFKNLIDNNLNGVHFESIFNSICPTENIKNNLENEDPKDILANGAAHLHKGEYNQALECFYKAIKIAEKTLVPGDATRVTINYFIGQAHLFNNNPFKALEYLYKAIYIEEINWPDFPDTARTYELIGSAYRLIGDKDNALRYFDKAYKIFKGNDHEYTLRVLKMINEIK